MRKSKRKKIWIIGILFVLAAAVWITWEVYRSYHCLETTQYTVTSQKIKNPIRLTVIADLHDHQFGEKNEELIKAIQKSDPDAILMLGDIINDISADDKTALDLVTALKEYKVYYALGNQEIDYMKKHKSKKLLSDLEKAGAVVLDETFEDIYIEENPICIAGIYEYAFEVDGAGHMSKKDMEPKIRTFLEEFQKKDSFKLMMAHRPDSFIFGDAADTWEIDLLLSGHNHGGQVILPGVGGLYGGDQGWFPEYVFGRFHFKAVKDMIITRGLGSDKEALPRFHNVPEIVDINLKPE